MRNRRKIWMLLILGIGCNTVYSQSQSMQDYFAEWKKNLVSAQTIFYNPYEPIYDFSEENSHNVIAIFVDNQIHGISEDAKWMLEQLLNLSDNSKSFLINQIKRIDKDIRMSTKWINLPFNISNLALATTAFNAHYTDNAYSYGCFATPYYVALSEGLRIDSIYDERMNTVMSAYATAQYINRLHDHFGRWTHALYAYLHTPGHMQELVRSRQVDYVDNIPFEALIASLLFTKKYQDLLVAEGSDLPNFEIVQIKDKVHIRQLSDYLNLSEDSLRYLNPEILGDVIYGNLKRTAFRLPQNYGLIYSKKAKEIAEYKKEEFFPPQKATKKSSGDILAEHYDITYYKIRSGDNLGGIARRFGVRISDLQTWNNIRGETIYAGSTLMIYRPKVNK